MANEAQVTSWAIDVKTGQSAAEVESLAKSLEQMRDSMKANTGEMAAMQKAIKNLRGGGDDFKAQADAMQAQLDAKRKATAQLQAEYLKLGGVMKPANQNTRPPKPPKLDPPPKVDPPDVSSAAKIMAQLKTDAAESNTRFGRLVQITQKWAEVLGKGRLVLVGMTVALVATGAALAVFAKRMTESALAAQDARRSEFLHLEALTRKRNLYGFVAGNAKEMQATIDRVSQSVSINRGEVTALGTQLYNSGLRGKNFATVLEAASIKASALGSAAGSAFAGFASDVQRAGGSAARAAQDVKNRFGDVVQMKMKSLEVQTQKAKEGFDSLFSGVDVEPLLTANKSWNDTFSTVSETGKALRSFATAFIQPIADATVTVWNVVRRFFKQMIIGALEVGIAYRTLKLWYVRALGGPEIESVAGKLFTFIKPGRVLVYALAAAFGVLALKVAIATWPFLLAAAAVWGLFEIVNGLYALWREIDWTGLGTAIVDGLVSGLKKTWTAVKTVAGDLANELSGAFKLALGIQSPSKVFAEYGLQIPRGVEAGIVKGSPDASAAAAKIVRRPPDVGPVGPAAAPSGGARGATVTVQTINITPGAGTPAEQVKEIGRTVRRELETLLAGLGEQMGAGRV